VRRLGATGASGSPGARYGNRVDQDDAVRGAVTVVVGHDAQREDASPLGMHETQPRSGLTASSPSPRLRSAPHGRLRDISCGVIIIDPFRLAVSSSIPGHLIRLASG
jgi:hypothetical protein